MNYYDREEEKSHETSIESDVTDKNEIRKCLQVFADVLEYVSLHPMLYDPKHSDYNNDVEILTVWNYIYKVHKIKKNQDERGKKIDTDTKIFIDRWILLFFLNLNLLVFFSGRLWI